ncbi:MAG: hypothetical protein ABIE23_05325 [archaeon]
MPITPLQKKPFPSMGDEKKVPGKGRLMIKGIRRKKPDGDIVISYTRSK